VNASSLPTVPAPGDPRPGDASGAPATVWSGSDKGIPFDAATSFPSRPAVLASEHSATIGHIGRYALKHRLGEGGLGTVFAAHDPLLSRLIAVKTLHLEVAEERRAAFNAMFLNEARAAAGLSHPQIVTVFDAGISDDRAYIAMELLKGRDLRQLRQEGWRPTPAQAALIARRVADALAYAHSKGVVHRDIKPANIFMVSRTQPRVLDFGIARIAHQRDVAAGAELAAGSPYYMSPEQVRQQPVDRRADVFSLGVVLYELLADVKPFRGTSLAEITDAVLHHEPPLASSVDPSVPSELAAIVARAMAKDPARRHRSAGAFARDLREWLEDNPAPTDTDPPPPSRRPWLWAGAAVLGCAMLGTFAWLVGSPRQNAAPEAASTVPAGAASMTAAAPSDPPAAPQSVPDSLDAATASPGSVEAAASGAAQATAATPAVTPDVTLTPTTAAAAPAAAIAVAAPNATSPRASSPAAKEAPTKTALARESPAERKAREARELEARTRAASVAPVAAVLTGVVRIAISPWGRIEVDGADAGIAPPLNELTLPEGKHQITVRNVDFPPYSAAVTVTAGQPVTLKYRFGS
jgi:hypothetical protein